MAKGKPSIRQFHSASITTDAGLTLTVNGPTVTLRSDQTEQSRFDLRRPELIDFEYMQHMDCLLRAHTPESEPIRALHAGGGACALALAWASTRPGSSQVCVEIDDQLVNALKLQQLIPARSGIRLRSGNALSVLEGSSATYQVIVRDAFDGERTPEDMAGTKWANLAHTRLRSGGLYLANVAHGPGTSGKSDVAAASSVFDNLTILADRKVWRGTRRGNLTVAAWTDGALDMVALERSVRMLPLPIGIFRGEEISSWLAGAKPAP